MRNRAASDIKYFSSTLLIRSDQLIVTEGVPASLLMSDARWPGVTFMGSTQFAGKRKSCVEETAISPTSIILIRKPPVEEVEPEKLIFTP
jgi:hypothetical protein